MEEKNHEIVPQYFYTEKEMDKLSAYIKQQYGEFETEGITGSVLLIIFRECRSGDGSFSDLRRSRKRE
jgi:hypothetical protein